MSRPRRRAIGVALAVALTVGLALGSLAPAAAGGIARPRPRLTYTCTLAATDLGTSIRVVYRLRTDQPRWRWRVRIWDRKRLLFADITRTDDHGWVVVRVRTRDLKGPDALRARGRNLATNRICAVSLKA